MYDRDKHYIPIRIANIIRVIQDKNLYVKFAVISYVTATDNRTEIKTLHMISRILNRPYSYSRCCAGIDLQLRLKWGVFSNANDINLFLMIFPRMSLYCKLVPVQYREYEYGLLKLERSSLTSPVLTKNKLNLNQCIQ